jgi:hypothetical protein
MTTNTVPRVNRSRGAWSHPAGEIAVEECVLQPGTRAVCIREVQKSLVQSSKHLVETKIADLGVGHLFRCLTDRTETPGGGVILYLALAIILLVDAMNATTAAALVRACWFCKVKCFAISSRW